MTQNDLAGVFKTVTSDVPVMVIVEGKLRTVDDITIVYKATPPADTVAGQPPAKPGPPGVVAIVLTV